VPDPANVRDPGVSSAEGHPQHRPTLRRVRRFPGPAIDAGRPISQQQSNHSRDPQHVSELRQIEFASSNYTRIPLIFVLPESSLPFAFGTSVRPSMTGYWRLQRRQPLAFSDWSTWSASREWRNPPFELAV